MACTNPFECIDGFKFATVLFYIKYWEYHPLNMKKNLQDTINLFIKIHFYSYSKWPRMTYFLRGLHKYFDKVYYHLLTKNTLSLNLQIKILSNIF